LQKLAELLQLLCKILCKKMVGHRPMHANYFRFCMREQRDVGL